MLVKTNLLPKLAIELLCVEQMVDRRFNRDTDNTAVILYQFSILLCIIFLFDSCDAVAKSCFLFG